MELHIIAHVLRLLALLFITCDEPVLHTFEARMPGGVITERYTYYRENDKEIRHGTSVLYFADGRQSSITEFVHGKRNGKVTTYYERIEKKEFECEYKNGIQDGISRSWSPEGELMFECEYRNGEPWQGRTSTGSLWSHGSTSISASFSSINYEQGKLVAGSEKSFNVKFQTQRRNDLPDLRSFLRWHWYPYDIDSDYPYLKELPCYDKVPFLIEWCANGGSVSDVAHSQLTALTRVDFGSMRSLDDSKRKSEVENWKSWWEKSGKDRQHNIRDNGAVDPAAWRLVARERDLPVPTTPISLPKGYTIEWSFRSGEDGGIVSENLRLSRSATEAKLTRIFSNETGGESVSEEWQGFDVADADRTARAIGYLIDHPWLLNDELEINRRFWDEQDKNKGAFTSTSFPNPKLAGRESFGMYYPGVTFVMLDGKGNVWWNDDPWTWHGPNEMRFNSAAQRILSSTYPFITSQYPESTRFSKTSGTGWRKIDSK